MNMIKPQRQSGPGIDRISSKSSVIFRLVGILERTANYS